MQSQYKVLVNKTFKTTRLLHFEMERETRIFFSNQLKNMYSIQSCHRVERVLRHLLKFFIVALKKTDVYCQSKYEHAKMGRKEEKQK